VHPFRTRRADNVLVTDARTRSRTRNPSTSTRWTLRGRRIRLPPPTTERLAEQEKTRSPLTDSNRRPPPYHGFALRSKGMGNGASRRAFPATTRFRFRGALSPRRAPSRPAKPSTFPKPCPQTNPVSGRCSAWSKVASCRAVSSRARKQTLPLGRAPATRCLRRAIEPGPPLRPRPFPAGHARRRKHGKLSATLASSDRRQATSMRPPREHPGAPSMTGRWGSASHRESGHGRGCGRSCSCETAHSNTSGHLENRSAGFAVG
jgi:hypothetical protein